MHTPTQGRSTLGLLVALAMLLGLASVPAAAPAEARSSRQQTVRLLTVGAATTGDLLDQLVAEFAEQTGYEVTVTIGGANIFDRARAGEADIVLAHFGFVELERFVTEQHGLWPKTVMSNIVVFLVPPGDPARVGKATDPVDAFQRIADLNAPFIVNGLGETAFISETLWHTAGRPDKGTWFLDLGLSGPAAVREATRRGGYTLWGLHPFLELQQTEQPVNLRAAIINDSLMERILATVVVTRAPGISAALEFQTYLTSPSTQARIRNYRLRPFTRPIFLPAANNNDN